MNSGSYNSTKALIFKLNSDVAVFLFVPFYNLLRFDVSLNFFAIYFL